jgi:hypothetical protein
MLTVAVHSRRKRGIMKSGTIAWVAVIGVFGVAGALFTLGGSPASPDRGSPTPPARGDAAQLSARRALGSHVNAVENALSGLPSFGGTWFKQAGDGVIVVGLTSPPTAAVTQTVNSAVPANSAVEFVQVPVSYSQLKALYKSITATPLSVDGILEVAIQTADNTVAVGVATQAVADAVYAKYSHTGLTVTVAAPAAAAVGTATTATAAPSRNFTSGPLYGGEWVTFGDGGSCTMGFGYLTNAAGQLSALTAGHCAVNGSAAHQGDSTSDPAIGSGVHDNQVTAGGTTDCDCSFLGPISSSQISHQTLVKNNSLYTFTATGIPYVADNECHSGAQSYESNGGNIVCGQVLSINAEVLSINNPTGNFTLDNAIQWAGPTLAGDSGAPVGDGPNLMGFVSGASLTKANVSYFTKASIVYAQTGIALNY